MDETRGGSGYAISQANWRNGPHLCEDGNIMANMDDLRSTGTGLAAAAESVALPLGKFKRMGIWPMVAVLASAVGVVCFMLSGNNKRIEREIVARTQQHLLTIARTQAHGIKMAINHIKEEMERLSGDPRLKQLIIDNPPMAERMNEDRFSLERETFESLSDFGVQVAGLVRMDVSAVTQNKVPFNAKRIGLDFSDKPGIGYVLETHEPYISKVHESISTNKCISVNQPVFKDGEFLGIIRANIPLVGIEDLISHIQVGEKGYAVVIDGNGTLVAHPDPKHIGKNAIALRKELFPDSDWSQLEIILDRMAGGQEGTGQYHSMWWQDETSEPVMKLMSFAPIDTGGESWSIGVVMGYDEISGPIKAHSRRTMISVAALIVVVVAIVARVLKIQRDRTRLMTQAQSAQRLASLNEQLESEIIERKKVDQQREELVELLEEKNRELESIIHVANHDLNTPLISITGFAGELATSCQEIKSALDEQDDPAVLKKKLNAIVNEDIPESLGIITASTAKITSMLDGLMRLAKLGFSATEITQLNMNRKLRNIVRTLEFQANKAGVKFEIGELPQGFGDSSQIDRVFYNLLSNALKYLDPSRQGEISITGWCDDGMNIYCVEDNGIGIDQNNLTNIFKMYYRVDSHNGSGQGIGLAIVRRIALRHNGRVWAESEPNRGSRFFVALPILQRSKNAPEATRSRQPDELLRLRPHSSPKSIKKAKQEKTCSPTACILPVALQGIGPRPETPLPPDPGKK